MLMDALAMTTTRNRSSMAECGAATASVRRVVPGLIFCCRTFESLPKELSCPAHPPRMASLRAGAVLVNEPSSPALPLSLSSRRVLFFVADSTSWRIVGRLFTAAPHSLSHRDRLTLPEPAREIPAREISDRPLSGGDRCVPADACSVRCDGGCRRREHACRGGRRRARPDPVSPQTTAAAR